VASYNGIDLGIVEECNTWGNPRELQVNAYCGVDGLEVLDAGGRGGESHVVGALAGVDVGDLAAIKGALRAAQLAGGAAAFVDDEGTAWADVVLVRFRPFGRRYVGGDGVAAQRYEMDLMHVD
jgi:hypothetical protein